MLMRNIILFTAYACLLILSCNNPSTQRDVSKSPKLEPSKFWLELEGNPSLKKSKKIVLVSGDEEYRSEEMLPQLAKILAKQHGFDCKVLFAQDTSRLGIVDPNFTQNIPGTEILEDADLMILFTRFRALPQKQMQYFQNYLEKGKPILAIRTATHAFNFKDKNDPWAHWGNYYDGEKTDWHGGFGKKILGANWHTHHGHHKHQSTRGFPTETSSTHPITANIDIKKIWGATDVYGHPLPLPDDSEVLVLGETINRAGEFDETDLFFGMKSTDNEVATKNTASKNNYNPNNPMMPIVWTKSYQVEGGKKGTSLTSTIGASTDFLNKELRQLFVNATYFLLDLDVQKNPSVNFEGTYTPTQFSFHTDEYWEKKDKKIGENL